jgi:DNA polymerase I-like protein with 3'-5' exonuclease and polymerase domains
MSFVFWDGEHDLVMFDCRNGSADIEALKHFIKRVSTSVFVAFNISAEMWALSQLGIDVKPLAWVDLMVESTMITGTHSGHKTKQKNFVVACRMFGVPREDYAKKDMYELILSKPGNDFTDEEFADILLYNASDVKPLKALWGRIQYRLLHSQGSRGVWQLQHSLERAEYCKACFILSYRTKGLPIDEPWLNDIAKYLKEIRNAIIEDCNKQYGEKFWVWDHIRLQYVESNINLANYIRKMGLDSKWQKTAKSGSFKTTDSYFDEMVKEYPFLKPLKTARDLVNQTKKFDLPSLVKDGYVKPHSIPFYTVTSRNQPMVKEGFVFNMAPWIRSVVRPKPGMVLIGLDWSKQEIAIAAALTGDVAFTEAYNTGDVYAALAKRSGAIPKDANLSDKNHPSYNDWKVARQAYKSVQLGLGYGMGKTKLGASIYSDLNMNKQTEVITMVEATDKAIEIYDWHKATFKQYWDWLKTQATKALQQGGTHSKDHWIYYTDKGTNYTQVLNFPIQANGAAMLRKAVKSLAFETDIDVCCSLHDAIYFNCKAEEAEAQIAIVQEHMARAVREIIGDEITIETEPKISTPESGYLDERGAKTLQMIRDLVAKLKDEPLPERVVRPEYTWREEKPRKTPKKHIRLTATIVDAGKYFKVLQVTDISGKPVKTVRQDVCFQTVEEVEREIAFKRGIEPCYVIVELVA